jgi:hypothetical protein
VRLYCSGCGGSFSLAEAFDDLDELEEFLARIPCDRV